jgi:hypothetical protein
MNWKDLYVGALRRPESVEVLLAHGLRAVQSSHDADLQRKVSPATATPFKLCAVLDAHGVPVPLDAQRHVTSEFSD